MLRIKKIILTYRFTLFLIIFFLLITRIFYILEGLNEPRRILESVSDAKEYHELALNLSEGKGFTRNGKFETYRTPLFPFFLSIFYKLNKSPLTNFVINVILSIILLIFSYKKMKKKSFYLFSIFFILSPNLNFHSLLPTADFFFGFFLYFLYIFLKENRFLFSILILSLLPYIKPVALLLPLFLFMYFLIIREFKRAFFILIFPLAISFVWVLIVYKNLGFLGFSSVIPVNFFSYYVPFSVSLKDKISFSEAREKMSDELLKELGENFNEGDIYYGMIKISLKELKRTFPEFLISHFIFSFNTLFSPISLKPLIVYFSGKDILRGVQQEFFGLFLKGKILKGIEKIFKERIIFLGLKGIFILLFSIFFHILLLILFFKKLLKNFRDSFLLIFILFPLIFSTGILGDARLRVLFEVLLIYFTFS
ncbi:MAG: hypothetical protein ABIN73_01930 [candidate division WOR-3 bacterium]